MPTGLLAEPAAAVPVDTGTARLLPDPDRTNAWTLTVDAIPQSHVDLDDPTALDFPYIRWLAALVDLMAARRADRPLVVVHLGGGGLTLARYVAATCPRSRQQVFEVDAALLDLVRRELPLPPSLRRRSRIRLRALDARAGLTRLPDGMADVVVADVFAGAVTPAHVSTVEFV